MNKISLNNRFVAIVSVLFMLLYGKAVFAADTDFTVRNVSFNDSDGNILTSFDELTGGMEISAEITNNAGTEKSIVLLAGIYEGENLKTVKLCTADTECDMENVVELSFSADELLAASVNESDYMSVYFWDGIETMVPVCEAVEFPEETSVYNRNVSEFTAACGNQKDMSIAGGMTWNRIDFSWQSVQPTEDGGFSETQLESWGERILQCKENGITMLPILDYTANWAADPASYEYTYGGTTYSYGEAQEIEGDKTYWNRERTLTKSDGTVSTQTVKQRKSRQRFKDVALWEAYVEKIVSTYSAEPYNLEYFQVWNEAHPSSGFWDGGMDYYMTVLHKSAADIIHKYDCKVVYGGWPSCGGINQYCNLLDEYDAWDDIDVYDLHYYNVDNMYTVYKRALKAGIKSPKVWATEVGWLSNNGWICSMYSRMMYMALMNRSEQSEQFKAFYFSWEAPNDPEAYGYGKVMHYTDGTLTYHGNTMKMFMDTFKGQNVERYTHMKTSTGLSYSMTGGTSLQAFEIDGKRIAATVTANVTDTAITDIIGDAVVTCEGVYGTKTVKLTDYEGSEYYTLDFTEDENGKLTFTVPSEYLKTHQYNSATNIYCYIIIDAYKIVAPENNISDFEYGSSASDNKSIITPGRWSYVDCYYASPRPLQKGIGTGKFSVDEWTVDNKKSAKAWCVSANGNIYTDTRHVGYNYTIDESMSGEKLAVTGIFNPNSKSRTIKIYKTTDTDAETISSEKELLFEYTGSEEKEISLEISGCEVGNDILFEVYSNTASDYTTYFNLNAEISLS